MRHTVMADCGRFSKKDTFVLHTAVLLPNILSYTIIPHQFSPTHFPQCLLLLKLQKSKVNTIDFFFLPNDRVIDFVEKKFVKTIRTALNKEWIKTDVHKLTPRFCLHAKV